MTIRRAEIEDIDQLQTLEIQALPYEEGHSSEQWRDIIMSNTVFCHVNDDGITGAIVATQKPKNLLKVDEIFVGKDHRAQGIGSKLLDTLVSLQDNRHQSTFLLATNPDAIPLYKRHGFTDFQGTPTDFMEPEALALFEATGIYHKNARYLTREPQELAL